jgi:hypothetical protein
LGHEEWWFNSSYYANSTSSVEDFISKQLNQKKENKELKEV